MKTHLSDTLIDIILALIFTFIVIPQIIGIALLKIFIDDICRFGTHQGDKRRFKRIVG